MRLAKFAFAVLLSLASLSLATSCGISTNPVELTPTSLDSAGEIRVTGDATSYAFSEDTYVEVNCNADNSTPGALEQIVRGRSTFSSTALSYSATCSYPFAATDVTYKIAVRVLPDDVLCRKGVNEFAEITARGTGQPQTNAPANNGSDGANDAGNGNPVTPPGQNPNSPNAPPAPTDVEAFTVQLEPGWNLIGVPFATVTSEESTCDTVWFTYDAIQLKYNKVTALLTPVDTYGKGIWVKASERCNITFRGEYAPRQDINLVAGWNLISVQTQAFANIDYIRSSCRASGSALKYNAVTKQYEVPTSYEPGLGYWLKVAGNCVIGAGS